MKTRWLLILVAMGVGGGFHPPNNHDRRFLPSHDVARAPGQDAYVDTVSAVAGGIPLAKRELGGQDAGNLFSLPAGVTASSLLDQVAIAYADLHDVEVYAEEFDPGEAGNPYPGHYAVVFNSGVGNPNILGGPREASNTVVHELIHVAYGRYGARSVAGAVGRGWVNDDGGEDLASQTAQETNSHIVEGLTR